jgi:hypothetical protein
LKRAAVIIEASHKMRAAVENSVAKAKAAATEAVKCGAVMASPFVDAGCTVSARANARPAGK